MIHDSTKAPDPVWQSEFNSKLYTLLVGLVQAQQSIVTFMETTHFPEAVDFIAPEIKARLQTLELVIGDQLQAIDSFRGWTQAEQAGTVAPFENVRIS